MTDHARKCLSEVIFFVLDLLYIRQVWPSNALPAPSTKKGKKVTYKCFIVQYLVIMWLPRNNRRLHLTNCCCMVKTDTVAWLFVLHGTQLLIICQSTFCSLSEKSDKHLPPALAGPCAAWFICLLANYLSFVIPFCRHVIYLHVLMLVPS